MADLDYEIREEDEGLRLVLRGELDMRSAPSLRDVLRGEIQRRATDVTVDLAGVGFIDSSILATLVEGLKLTRDRGGNLVVVNCRPAVRDTFDISRLTDSFGIE